MSQENVEIVRATFEAWNAGDMDAFRDLHDPNVFVSGPDPRGVAASQLAWWSARTQTALDRLSST